jgi:hypothetical protein
MMFSQGLLLNGMSLARYRVIARHLGPGTMVALPSKAGTRQGNGYVSANGGSAGHHQRVAKDGRPTYREWHIPRFALHWQVG